MSKKSTDKIRGSFRNDLLLNLGFAHNSAWTPNLAQTFLLASKYRKELNVLPASQDTVDPDRMRTHLLLVNPQKDFACEKGFPWSSGDKLLMATNTIVKFIYDNVENITRITPTLTNHFPFQIMFAPFWFGQDEEMPKVGTEITAEDVEKGIWKPNPAMALWLCQNEYEWLVKQTQHYCEKLEEQKKVLTIMPSHCMHGSLGYGIVGVIDEARMFHSWVRSMQAECEVNGSNPLAQNYSFLGPHVTDRKDGEGPVGWKNIPALAATVMTDNLVLAGHYAVAETARDILVALGPEPEKWPCRLFYLADGVCEDMPQEFASIKSVDDIPPLESDEDEETPE